MTRTAIDQANAMLDDAEAVALAYRDELNKRLDAWSADPSPDATAGLCDAMHQLGAARRHLNRAAKLHKTLKTRQRTDTPKMLNNWAPNHDPRNRAYPIAPALAGATRVPGLWTVAPAMNQGDDGACVGYAVATAAHRPEQAEQVYSIAKTLDKFPGEAYSGTSVTAGAQAAKALDLITEYRWAFGADEVVDAIVNVGPVVLGLYWTEGMRDLTSHHLMTHSGKPIGGHCTLAIGYSPEGPDGAPAIVIQNSWGTGWGDAGRAWLNVSDLTTLLQRQGEACVVTPA